MFGGPLRVLEIFGDSSDLGRGHGSSCSQMIQKYLDDRMTLTAQEEWGGKTVDRDLILELAEGTLQHHERFSESLFVEMVTMSKAADITAAEAVVVGGFTDLVDVIRTQVGSAPAEHNCTAVINPQAGFYAQTWDMHASAGEFVVMLKLDPLIGPDVLVQTTAGCLGQMGMNEAGISVGINNLTAMGKPGVTWPFVVRKVLEQTDLERAIDVVVEAPLAGGLGAAFSYHPLVVLIAAQALFGWVWFVLRRSERVKPMSHRMLNIILLGTAIAFSAVWIVRLTSGTLPPI